MYVLAQEWTFLQMALRSFLPLLKRLVSGIWKWHWRPNKAVKTYNCGLVLRWEIVQSFLPLSSKAGQWHMKVALTARPSNHGCQLISHQTSSCTAGFHWDCTNTSIKDKIHKYVSSKAELQKRADRADQSVLFFLAGANFWEKHAKNC